MAFAPVLRAEVPQFGGRRLSGSTVGDDLCIVACLDAPPSFFLAAAGAAAPYDDASLLFLVERLAPWLTV